MRLSLLRSTILAAALPALFAIATPLSAEPVPSDSEIRQLEVLSSSAGITDTRAVAALVRDLNDGEFNRVAPEVRTTVGVAWPSELEPPLPFVTSGFRNPLLELQAAILESRRSAVESGKLLNVIDLMPIVSVMPAHSALMGTKYPPNSPLGHAPGMANLNVRGEMTAPGSLIHLDPGNPATRTYLQALFLELARIARPDGVILEDFAYPGKEWGYSADAIAAFREVVGGDGPPQVDDPTWSAWRREQLTECLRVLGKRMRELNREFRICVVIDAEGQAPTTWEEWIASPTYAEHMQDWIGWCREGAVDEVMLRLHLRQGADTAKTIDGWARFLSDNCRRARPVMSLSGSQNFTEAVVSQYRAVRTRGIGTSLFHYAEPTRDRNIGFFQSMPVQVFNTSPGTRLDSSPLDGTPEVRTFSRMSPPPASVVLGLQPTPSPTPNDRLRFATPTPVPTATPELVVKPEAIQRRITLNNGRTIDGRVLEVRGQSYIILPQGGTQIEVPKSLVTSVEPPL